MKKFMQQDGEEHLQQFFKLPNPGLRAYFARTREGNNADYRTPLWRGEAREKVISAGAQKLEALGLNQKFPSLMAYEDEMKSKIGPLSIQVPLKDRLTDIESYYTSPIAEIPGETLLIRGMLALKAEGKSVRGLRMLSNINALHEMKLNTNSGAPLFIRRNKEEAKEQALSWVEWSFEKYKAGGGNIFFPKHLYNPFPEPTAILGWRGQEGGPEPSDTKQRVVGMFPMGVNLAESLVYTPLIKALQARKLVPAYISNEEVDHNITQMFNTKGSDDLVVCTDFTKYDQHFNVDMQVAAQMMYLGLFTGTTKMSGGLDIIFPIKFNIPIQCDSNMYFRGPHGMASGSGGTNMDETIVHRCFQHAAAINAGKSLNRYSQCNGDDGVLTFPGITVDKVIDTYTSFGQEMNPDKQYVSKHECVYLRRGHADYYRKDGVCVGVYSTYRALGKLLGQERYYDPDKWSREMVILRSLSILENCKHHPLFHEFIDFVLEGDKYRLGLDLPGFFDKLKHYVKEAIDMKESFLGYNRTNMSNSTDGIDGIEAGEVIKYLKTKIS